MQFLRGAASRELTFWSMVRADGFVRMWRGASAVLAVTLPSHAAYFATYELVKERLGVNEAGHHPLAAAAVGASATTLHDAVLTPMDVVKQRLQLGYYRGVGHCVRTMLKTEGLRAFYRSYPTTVVMNMPYAAAIVSANESMKKVLIPEGTTPSPYAFFLAAGVAGAFAAAVTCPLDVVKTRLQTAALTMAPPPSSASSGVSAAAARAAAAVSGASGASGGGGSHRHHARRLATLQASVTPVPGGAAGVPRGAIATARAMLQEEGPAVFFKGVRARMAFHVPAAAISWGTYEMVKRALAAAAPTGSDLA